MTYIHASPFSSTESSAFTAMQELEPLSPPKASLAETQRIEAINAAPPGTIVSPTTLPPVTVTGSIEPTKVTSVASFNPCNLLQILTDFQNQLISQIYQKFSALKRLAEILEKAGDISGLLDNLLKIIPNMIPLELLRGLEFYEKLRQSCPMLNLPQASFESATGDLQTQVAKAYANLLQQIDLHQFNRLDKLQQRLDDFVGQVRNAGGVDWKICAGALCGAVQSATSAAGQKAFTDELDRLKKLPTTAQDAATKPFQVIGEGTQQKVNDMKEARSRILALGQSQNPNVQAIFAPFQKLGK